MIKLMHIIYGFNAGGAETLVKDYAQRIDRNKFDLTILCFKNCNSQYDHLLKDKNIKVIYASDYQKFYNKHNFIFKVINHLQLFLFIKKYIHKVNPDVIHSHLPINKYIKFAKPKKNTKIFHTIHSEPKRYWPDTNNKDYKATLYLVKKYKMRFICLHDEMRKNVNDLFNVNNSIILNNGIDFSRFNKDKISNKITLKDKLNIPADAYIVGHIGRFIYEKNHSFLVDIFSKIYSKNKNAFLLMIGDGPKKQEVIEKLNLLKLNDRYLILSNRSDIPDLLGIMDCFVFPSIVEGLPVTLIEAQKMELPCFVSDSITKYITISNLITWLSVKKDCKCWANSIIDYKYPKKVLLNDNAWDMDNIVKKLENIYLDNI